jgi:hypothetical protein
MSRKCINVGANKAKFHLFHVASSMSLTIALYLISNIYLPITLGLWILCYVIYILEQNLVAKTMFEARYFCFLLELSLYLHKKGPGDAVNIHTKLCLGNLILVPASRTMLIIIIVLPVSKPLHIVPSMGTLICLHIPRTRPYPPAQIYKDKAPFSTSAGNRLFHWPLVAPLALSRVTLNRETDLFMATAYGPHTKSLQSWKAWNSLSSENKITWTIFKPTLKIEAAYLH